MPRIANHTGLAINAWRVSDSSVSSTSTNAKNTRHTQHMITPPGILYDDTACSSGRFFRYAMYEQRISDQTNMKRMAESVVTRVNAVTRFGTTYTSMAPPSRHTHENSRPREGT